MYAAYCCFSPLSRASSSFFASSNLHWPINFKASFSTLVLWSSSVWSALISSIFLSKFFIAFGFVLLSFFLFPFLVLLLCNPQKLIQFLAKNKVTGFLFPLPRPYITPQIPLSSAHLLPEVILIASDLFCCLWHTYSLAHLLSPPVIFLLAVWLAELFRPVNHHFFCCFFIAFPHFPSYTILTGCCNSRVLKKGKFPHVG